MSRGQLQVRPPHDQRHPISAFKMSWLFIPIVYEHSPQTESWKVVKMAVEWQKEQGGRHIVNSGSPHVVLCSSGSTGGSRDF